MIKKDMFLKCKCNLEIGHELVIWLIIENKAKTIAIRIYDLPDQNK